MSWTLLFGVVLALGFSLLVRQQRRVDLGRMRAAVRERDDAALQGTRAARLSHPVIDLSRCLGCATCVAVCPEKDVLEIVHGQAVVVRGSACQGVSACERECPTGAIKVTIANLEQRDDVPVLGEELEAIGAPGVFLAGEVTAHALIRRAIEQGTRAARAASDRIAGRPARADAHDLVVVGAGPAGLAAALEAKRLGLRTLVIDQEAVVGGTVAKYPRRKLVLTEPVDLPLHGRLGRTEYSREELMELWNQIAARETLFFAGGETFTSLEREADGTLLVRTETGAFRARNVCLALGRRGSPRKLGVPGEDLPHVASSLIDAASIRGRRILVVGGGDSAVEAALGLAGQPGNQVVLSYRGEDFPRVRRRNRERLEAACATRQLRVLTRSHVRAIRPGRTELEVETDGGPEARQVPADEVFVLIGGVPPFELLARAGVSFDPRLRVAAASPEGGSGRAWGLTLGFGVSLAVLLFALWHLDYYALSRTDRPAHAKHTLLRPGMGLGLAFGIASAVMIAFNLLYLFRRSPSSRLRIGTLKTWMTAHVTTGILALLLAALHAAMAPRDTVGGHAFWSLAVLFGTGAIGRFFYAWVPHAANGRELELDEVKSEIQESFAEGDAVEQDFGARARREVRELIDRRQWRAGFSGRVLSLLGVQFDLAKVLRRLRAEGVRSGIGEEKVRRVLALARRAHRTALSAAHYEDLRGILGSWRYLHRWVAALMVLLVLLHVVSALVYGEFFFDGA